MSSIKKLYLKAVSKALIAEFSKEGIKLKPTLSYQLINAAYGIWAHELAQKYEVPFETYVPQALPDAHPQFNMPFLIDRTVQLCELDEWRAQHMAQIVLDVLKQARLRINGIKVLFDPLYNNDRERIFKALRNPVFPSIHASVAIGNGELPLLPATSLHDRLQLVGPRYLLSGSRRTLHNLIMESKTYLWVNPAVEFKGAELAYRDIVINPDTAELGLGFCLIQPFTLPNEDRHRYTVVSPTLHYRKQQSDPWSELTVHSTTYLEHSAPRPWLTDLLEHGIESLPVLKVCLNCLQIYSNDLKEINRTCTCADVDAARIHAILNEFRAEGVTQFTTIDLIVRLNGKEYEVDRETPVNKSQNADRGRFLSKHSATFGIRFLEEVSAKDKNGRDTTTAKWAIIGEATRP